MNEYAKDFVFTYFLIAEVPSPLCLNWPVLDTELFSVYMYLKLRIYIRTCTYIACFNLLFPRYEDYVTTDQPKEEKQVVCFLWDKLLVIGYLFSLCSG